MTLDVTTRHTGMLANLLQHKPQSLMELTGKITPAIHAELKRAVELGKFSDGTRLSAQQLENCLQLVILYESENLPESERTGFNLPASCKTRLDAGLPRTDSAQVEYWNNQQS